MYLSQSYFSISAFSAVKRYPLRGGNSALQITMVFNLLYIGKDTDYKQFDTIKWLADL